MNQETLNRLEAQAELIKELEKKVASFTGPRTKTEFPDVRELLDKRAAMETYMNCREYSSDEEEAQDLLAAGAVTLAMVRLYIKRLQE